MTKTKVCRKHGGDPLPRSAFSPNKRMRDGLHSYCRVCNAKMTRERTAKNKEGGTYHRLPRDEYSPAAMMRAVGTAEIIRLASRALCGT